MSKEKWVIKGIKLDADDYWQDEGKEGVGEDSGTWVPEQKSATRYSSKHEATIRIGKISRHRSICAMPKKLVKSSKKDFKGQYEYPPPGTVFIFVNEQQQPHIVATNPVPPNFVYSHTQFAGERDQIPLQHWWEYVVDGEIKIIWDVDKSECPDDNEEFIKHNDMGWLWKDRKG